MTLWRLPKIIMILVPIVACGVAEQKHFGRKVILNDVYDDVQRSKKPNDGSFDASPAFDLQWQLQCEPEYLDNVEVSLEGGKDLEVRGVGGVILKGYDQWIPKATFISEECPVPHRLRGRDLILVVDSSTIAGQIDPLDQSGSCARHETLKALGATLEADWDPSIDRIAIVLGGGELLLRTPGFSSHVDDSVSRITDLLLDQNLGAAVCGGQGEARLDSLLLAGQSLIDKFGRLGAETQVVAIAAAGSLTGGRVREAVTKLSKLNVRLGLMRLHSTAAAESRTEGRKSDWQSSNDDFGVLWEVDSGIDDLVAGSNTFLNETGNRWDFAVRPLGRNGVTWWRPEPKDVDEAGGFDVTWESDKGAQGLEWKKSYLSRFGLRSMVDRGQFVITNP